MTSVAAMISALRPIMDLAEPILKAKPEVCEERQTVKKIKGSIELNNISFRYTDDGPWIIDHLNLKIPRGQYLAIVGTTGCGKTTLMRLMMGFETPKSGAVYIMMGRVVHGKAAGRKHGMPTANLGVAANKLFPPHGVYGTLSIIDGRYYRGMTNIGLRPSDDDIPIATIETFILNFDQDIYDKDVLLQVYAYIRGVKKFSGGLDEVRKQIDKDIQDVKSYMDEVVRKLGI